MQVDTTFIGKRDEAQDVKTFMFERPSEFVYTAGQYAHFDLHKLTHPDERGPSHHFSLSSSPLEDFISFTTKIRPESGYKQTFMEMAPGEMITVRGPKGFFILDDEHTTTPQLMIAGGIA